MGYHAGKPIESVVYCFYKISLKYVSVFYEFTGPLKHRFLTNQDARTIVVILYSRISSTMATLEIEESGRFWRSGHYAEYMFVALRSCVLYPIMAIRKELMF